MMKFLVLLFFAATSVQAYVPTVESLFRHGSNPDVTANGVSITMVVRKAQPAEKTENANSTAVLSDKAEDFYKVFFTKTNDGLKVAQSRYSNNSFTESSLLGKTYYPHFNSYTIKPDVESAEKGLFYSMLDSILFNNGSHMVNFLKALGIPARLNNEIINRDKVEFLAQYKKYLILINKDRNARKTEMNPMQPTDPAARERVEAIMAEPMYVDTKQVKLSKGEGEIVWAMTAGPFEAVFSYKNRDLMKLKYKSAAGEFEVSCKDYWLANGTHAVPRFMNIKTFNGQQYQVEITNLRHYIEKEEDIARRLKNWDAILKGKESPEVRPEFLL